MPLVLRLALRERLSGSLVLTAPGGAAPKTILLDDGSVVYATAGGGEPRLGDQMVAWGIIPQEGVERALERMSATGELMGRAFVSLGFASEEVVRVCVSRQISERVADLFPLQDCDVCFEAKPHVERRPFLAVGMADLMLAGMRRVSDLARVERWIGDLDAPLMTARDPLGAFSQMALTSEEAFLLSRLDHTLSPREIAELGPLAEADALRLVCALRYADVLVNATAEHRLPGDDATLASLGIRRRPASDAPQIDAAEAARVFYLMEEKLRAVRDGADHYALLEVERRAPADRIKTSYRELAKTYHPDRHAQLAAFDEKIKEHLSAIFDALTKAYGVLSNAKEREAYDQRLAALAQQSARATPVAQAGPSPSRPASGPAAPVAPQPGRESSNDESNGDGHAQPRSPQQPPPRPAAQRAPAPPRPAPAAQLDADQWFERGQVYSSAGDHAAAARAFKHGTEVAPDDARMHAAFGRALYASGGQYRKQAEAAYRKAIALAPSSPEYLLELAALYKNAGRHESARELYRKALIVDKDDPSARAALEAYEKPKKRFFGLAFWEKNR